MSVAVQEPCERPFRVPGYAGYVPGLKYAFGHTYGYDESRLFKSSHPQVSRRVDERRVQWCEPRKHVAVQLCEPRKLAAVQLCEPRKHAGVQCALPEEREGLQSAATQWSDQEAHTKKRLSAATQWAPADFSPLKTIPGYTGHLPGRNHVNPGKTYCKEVDCLLTNFHPKSNAILPISRYNFTSALQQAPDPEPRSDPYFDPRPPSTYANNYPIPGYQGFVPRVRTSTSSLGIRYIKAVEKSLHALHDEQQNRKALFEDDAANSPKKMLDKRPLHTPRHKPHPRQADLQLVYNRPPSTYLENSFIPGYRGFVPHLRGSPNVVGVRYSKAAQRCMQKVFPKVQKEAEDGEEKQEDGRGDEKEEGRGGDERDEVNKAEENNPPESEEVTQMDSNRLRKNTSAERPCKEEHSDYIKDRKPSTYRTDERYPIPGYQGFVPRLRDSPTTLGLRYTKAALKTLEDVHKVQAKKANG